MLTATRRRVAEAGRDPVLVVGVGMVLAQSLLRAWALFGSWFYADDFAMVGQARRPLSLDYLMEPYSIHLLPLGRLEAWVVERSGGLNWTVAASITLALSTLCGLACLWMLVTLFGRRWGVLAPLALYLTSAISISGTMWWAASLNQLPHQLALALAVGAWVRYLRTRSRGWLAAAAVAVLFGLSAYVKSALIIPLLAYLLLAFFVRGSLRERVVEAARRYWPAAVLFGVLGLAFSVMYLTVVPDVGGADGDRDALGLAGSMLGKTLATGLVGGPWRWSELNHPASFADPSEAAVAVAWVVIVAVVVYVAAVRTGTARAWALLGGYAVASYALLAASRAPGFGTVIGLEYRYLADLALVAPLCLGLATMHLRGAPASTSAREESLVTVSLRGRHVAAVTGLVAVLGTFSTVRYVQVWHDDNPGETYLLGARAALADEPLDLVDAAAPATAIPPVITPYNETSVLLPLVTTHATFPDWSRRLAMLDDRGNPHAVLLDPAATGVPDSDDGCGWQLFGADTAEVALTAEVFDWDWWVRLGYLSSDGGQVEVTAGDSTVVADVEPGANNLFLRLPGSFDTVTVEGLTSGTNVCLGQVEVGIPALGTAL